MTKIAHSKTAKAEKPKTQPQQTVKVLYADKENKNSAQFFVFAYDDMVWWLFFSFENWFLIRSYEIFDKVQKWKQDKSIPLVDVVEGTLFIRPF
jgi:hypothetical protein